MTSDQLGRRYERLLFVSGPLTLVAIGVLLIAFTSTTQGDRLLARCMEVAVDTLQKNEEKLKGKWEQYQAVKKKTKYHVNSYEYELKTIWISPGIDSGCYNAIEPFLVKGAETHPSDLVKNFSSQASALRNTPLQFRGIEIPHKAEVGIFGTNIKVNLDSLATALQISLAPILMIWLGSLYNTRYRESLIISKAHDISIMFPHLINIYPAVDLPSLRKRSYLAFLLPPTSVICTIYSLTRFCLILFVIGPAVGCYLVSLFLLPFEGAVWISFISGVSVGIFSFSAVIIEFFPWHAAKIFPGVIKK